MATHFSLSVSASVDLVSTHSNTRKTFRQTRAYSTALRDSRAFETNQNNKCLDRPLAKTAIANAVDATDNANADAGMMRRTHRRVTRRVRRRRPERRRYLQS